MTYETDEEIMMKCPILLELLQLKEYISAEQERHRRAVEKLLQQSEEKEAVGRRCHCNVVEDDLTASSTVKQRLLLRAAFQMLAEREAVKCRSRQKVFLEGALRKASKHKMGKSSICTTMVDLVKRKNCVCIDRNTRALLYPKSKWTRYSVEKLQLVPNEKNSSRNSHSSGLSPTRRRQVDQSKLLDLHCFELVHNGGRRRIWCTNSHQECFQWVEAIIRAMVDVPPRRWPQSPSRGQQSRSKSLEFAEDAATADIHTFPYLLDKYRYTSIRSGLKSASTVSKYLEELNHLGTGTQDCLIVPVTWVSETFEYILAPCRSRDDDRQIWKDMERDSICINGKVIPGENGLQYMVEELMTALLAQNSVMPVEISEAHCLEAAWEILFKCCRTTSAGDTYIVIKNLCHNSDLVVLVPVDHEAYPLAFTIAAVACEEESPSFSRKGEEVSPSPFSAFNDEFSSGGKPKSNSFYNQNSNNSPTNSSNHGSEAVLSPQHPPKLNSVKALLHWHLLTPKGSKRHSSYHNTSEKKQRRPGQLKNGDSYSKPQQHRKRSSAKYHHRRFFSDSTVTVPLELPPALSPSTRIDTQEEEALPWPKHKQEVAASVEEKNPTPRDDENMSSFHRNGGSGGGARIIVSCIARTSYKLTSANPMGMDHDVHAHLSGMFKQEFTIWPQPPHGMGSGQRIYTDGSLCYISLSEQQQMTSKETLLPSNHHQPKTVDPPSTSCSSRSTEFEI